MRKDRQTHTHNYADTYTDTYTVHNDKLIRATSERKTDRPRYISAQTHAYHKKSAQTHAMGSQTDPDKQIHTHIYTDNDKSTRPPQPLFHPPP